MSKGLWVILMMFSEKNTRFLPNFAPLWCHNGGKNRNFVKSYRLPLHPPLTNSLAKIHQEMRPLPWKKRFLPYFASLWHHNGGKNQNFVKSYRLPLHPPPTNSQTEFGQDPSKDAPSTAKKSFLPYFAPLWCHNGAKNRNFVKLYRLPLHPSPTNSQTKFGQDPSRNAPSTAKNNFFYPILPHYDVIIGWTSLWWHHIFLLFVKEFCLVTLVPSSAKSIKKWKN